MSFLMQMKWDGVTPEQYEIVRSIVNWEGDVPAGAMFHTAGFHNNALRVTDIWESPEHFNNFVQTRLMPGTAAAGIEGEPQLDVFPVHSIFNPYPDKLK